MPEILPFMKSLLSKAGKTSSESRRGQSFGLREPRRTGFSFTEYGDIEPPWGCRRGRLALYQAARPSPDRS
jgi:hypothetical protein